VFSFLTGVEVGCRAGAALIRGVWWCRQTRQLSNDCASRAIQETAKERWREGLMPEKEMK
jgi:hypothetical protein